MLGAQMRNAGKMIYPVDQLGGLCRMRMNEINLFRFENIVEFKE